MLTGCGTMLGGGKEDEGVEGHTVVGAATVVREIASPTWGLARLVTNADVKLQYSV